jgi:hypothetical protein
VTRSVDPHLSRRCIHPIVVKGLDRCGHVVTRVTVQAGALSKMLACRMLAWHCDETAHRATGSVVSNAGC